MAGDEEHVNAMCSCVIKMIRKVREVNISDVIQIFRYFAGRRQSFASAGTEKNKKKISVNTRKKNTNKLPALAQKFLSSKRTRTKDAHAVTVYS